MSLPARRDVDPAAPDRIAIGREELLDSYAHPYRRPLPRALKQFHVHKPLAADLPLAGLWALGAITDELSLQLLGATLLMLTLVITAGVLARAPSDGISAMADDGRLVTFAFTPLLADERPVRDATLIPGKPRYEAVEVRTEQFDAADAARAAEQLHADETRSTTAALRRITGQ